ncbi:unnamed protein product [Discula destructiva]
MAPWLPRMHLFEIHDQPWFHPWFRAKVQAALTETWIMQLPLVQQRGSPASIVAKILSDELGDQVGEYVFVDYCAGGGGPTPFVERYINSSRENTTRAAANWDGKVAIRNGQPTAEGDMSKGSSVVKRTESKSKSKSKTGGLTNGSSSSSPPAKDAHRQPVHFILTDLHPHIPNWTLAAAASPQIHYSPHSINAAASPPNLLATVEPPLPAPLLAASPKTFRTFNLAFHHLPTPLATSVLHDTLTTSSGFAIIELQDRHLRSFLAVCLLGLGVLAFAPYFAWKWRSPGTLFWSWVVPVLPVVLVWDGWMSSVRTRTVGEIEALMAEGGGGGAAKGWDTRTGRVMHLPPFAEVNWIIATKREGIQRGE